MLLMFGMPGFSFKLSSQNRVLRGSPRFPTLEIKGNATGYLAGNGGIQVKP